MLELPERSGVANELSMPTNEDINKEFFELLNQMIHQLSEINKHLRVLSEHVGMVGFK